MRSRISLAVSLGLLLGGILLADPARADQNDARLDALFARLKTTDSDDEASSIVRSIWGLWVQGPDNTSSRLLAAGDSAMQQQDFDAALSAFNLVIQRAPAFAEGFNQRATLYFQMGRYAESVADIQRTLALEPRHFGALSGLGQIYEAIGDKPAALKVLNKALELNPHSRRLKRKVAELEGRGI
jgi:tetratricopeptide (TPR) repeat protein